MKANRSLGLIALALLAFAMAGGGNAAGVPLPKPPTPQQLTVPVQNFFERLFGVPRRILKPPSDVGGTSSEKRKKSYRKSSDSAPPPPKSVPKDENAKQIVVFGDALASGLASGLEDALSETPTLAVSKVTNPGSGIVRDDYFNWDTAIADALDNQPVDVAVIMIGSNDRQPMRLEGGQREQVRSEVWEKLYIERVDRILNHFAARKIPVYWVGMPIMRSPSYGRDIAYINEIAEARVSRAGATFIDTWSRFADEEGRYSSDGPDVNGKNRRLRNDNGIFLTKHGNLKLAFFVEQELRAAFGDGGLVANVPLLGPNLPEPGHARGPVQMEISLTDPQAPPLGAPLLGVLPAQDKDKIKIDEEDTVRQLLITGKSGEAASGRADDFSWPPPSAQISSNPRVPPL